MIWFFEKQRSRLVYEIRRQADGHDYELVVTFPDGRQEVEQFEDPRALVERSQRLQETLRADGWEPPIRPDIRAAAPPEPPSEPGSHLRML
ncbi:MAG: hypothetical protein ACRD1V_20320 [Vicinamibacterales bacterium]